MFTFTSLLGAQSSSPASQSLLELDGGIKILIDVGWHESFDVELLQNLEKHIPTLSFILLTHATTSHLGAFAHCCKHFPLFSKIPIYATTPVISLGRSLLQDLYTSTPLAASSIPQAAFTDYAYALAGSKNATTPNILLQPPTPEEIASYFSLITPLKYSQAHEPAASPFSPPLNGLQITAYSAGHTLGGTIWHIQHGLESVVYAVDWNQAREHVLSGAAWLSTGGAEVIEALRRPTALICSSRASQRVALPGGRKKRDELLVELIKGTIAKGGTVLIPSDSSARILELAYMLEDAWAKDKDDENADMLRRARLFLASSTANATMRHTRSMLEWMAEEIVREFESAGGTGPQGQNMNEGKLGQKTGKAPFDFTYLKLLERKKQLQRALAQDGPKVFIASDTSMEWGFSRTLIQNIAHDPRNLVILTERISPLSKTENGIGRLLWNLWADRSGANSSLAVEDASSKVIDVDDDDFTYREVRMEKLAGNELAVYQQYLARQRQILNTVNAEKTTALETSADIANDASSSSSESSEEDEEGQQGKALNVTTAMTHSKHKLGLTDAELGIDILIRRKGHYDYDVRAKKGRERMFPFVTARRNQRSDAFGDVIRPEEYLRAEERDEIENEETRPGLRKESTLGQKRKWGDVAKQMGPGGRRAPNGLAKRPKLDGPAGEAMRGASVEQQEEVESESEDESGLKDGPVRAVFEERTLRLHIRLAYADFCGLHDKRSLQMLIPLIRPRKLILVGGETQETLALAADCKQLLSTSDDTAERTADIFTPVIGETVDASVDTNAWVVKLSKSMVKKLQWQNVRGLGVVAIMGQLAMDEGGGHESTTKKMRVTNGEENGEEGMEEEDEEKEENKADVNGPGFPVLDVVSAAMAARTRAVAQPVHVGDLRLADLRKLMQQVGYSAEFRGEGTLVINGLVTVRKSGTGRIEIDGIVGMFSGMRPDETFYEVKKRIYEGLAVVAGV
ncbi:hypothetical protein EJ06DRAFT_528664 [Trichodelitschia bisporula]|uniref:Cleavage and polyadenylation specificity factor subunit 2 n=1 Tax=Trichodelitschia bisporula TaxID=703511 RepID=A0A6G1I2Z3_9PEZI|nr:hypothetical protein EJ06DRAFT_528664 [Trichodelitschia bisporula]